MTLGAMSKGLGLGLGLGLELALSFCGAVDPYLLPTQNIRY